MELNIKKKTINILLIHIIELYLQTEERFGAYCNLFKNAKKSHLINYLFNFLNID